MMTMIIQCNFKVIMCYFEIYKYVVICEINIFKCQYSSSCYYCHYSIQRVLTRVGCTESGRMQDYISRKGLAFWKLQD